MKKILSLTALAGLLGVSSLQAQTDIYIDGSSAFKTSAYNAVTALFDSTGRTINHVSDSSWTISGTITSLFGSRTITVHFAATGSVQGIYSLYTPSATQNYLGTSGTTTTAHTATVCFSDVDSSSTSYPLDSTAFKELYVAVQPFGFCRSLANTALTNITAQQFGTLAAAGVMPQSIFTGKATDTTPIYLVNRNLDSGTRVTVFADTAQTAVNPVNYYWDSVNHDFYASNAGLDTALNNSLFGPGYITGSGVTGAINNSQAGCQAIGYVGIGDCRNVNSGKNVMTYNGVSPSSDITLGNVIPNDPAYDNVINGSYSYWAYECLDFPTGTPAGVGQNINSTDLQKFCAKLAGYDYPGLATFTPGQAGSIDADIANNISGGIQNNAVRLHSMQVYRQSVGGAIQQGVIY